MRLTPGDIVWIDLNPTAGHEQRGHRPALVISETETNHTLAIVVPLTTTDRGWSVHHRMSTAETSVALCDQVRAVDIASRVTRRAGRATQADLEAVRTIVGHLIGRY